MELMNLDGWPAITREEFCRQVGRAEEVVRSKGAKLRDAGLLEIRRFGREPAYPAFAPDGSAWTPSAWRELLRQLREVRGIPHPGARPGENRFAGKAVDDDD